MAMSKFCPSNVVPHISYHSKLFLDNSTVWELPLKCHKYHTSTKTNDALVSQEDGKVMFLNFMLCSAICSDEDLYITVSQMLEVF